MLQLIAAVGGGLFILASLAVGARLMALARTTRGLPELVLGAGLLTMGGIGYPLLIVAVNAKTLPDDVRVGMIAIQMLMNLGGMCGIAWFTRKVFRPGVAWATALFFAVVAAYLAIAFWQITSEGLLAFLAHPSESPWHIQTYLGIVVMSWAGIEALRYFAMQRRRLALGLADPVVADRFRLWAVAILTADSISIISTGAHLIWGVEMAASPYGAIVVGFLGLVASCALWLAFVPPPSYLARVRRLATA